MPWEADDDQREPVNHPEPTGRGGYGRSTLPPRTALTSGVFATDTR